MDALVLDQSERTTIPCDGWDVDEYGNLHLFREAELGLDPKAAKVKTIATFAKDKWISVRALEKEPAFA